MSFFYESVGKADADKSRRAVQQILEILDMGSIYSRKHEMDVW